MAKIIVKRDAGSRKFTEKGEILTTWQSGQIRKNVRQTTPH